MQKGHSYSKSIKRLLFGLLGGFAFILFLSFNKNEKITPYSLDIPPDFPQPLIPKDNQLTQARIDLGRRLFYDPVLSIDSSISCAHCHQQAYAFADTNAITPGVEGRLAMRNAPTLSNVAYNPTLLFDGFLPTLEMQVLVPIQEHTEFAHNIVDIAHQLQQNPTYVALSYAAYEREPDPFVITRSIAAFERTLISGNSKADQAKRGEVKLTRSEKRGADLFFNQLHCTSCHGGFNFTNFSTQNNGLTEQYADNGRKRATKKEKDEALFKVPTLRNIGLTAPYMHDGSLPNLMDVVLHYESGGANHPNKSPLLQPFQLSKKQRLDLIAFLNTLTDTSFITNSDFSNPFE